MLKYLVLFASGLLSALLLTPAIARLASSLGVVDHPDDDRRVHQAPTPRLGGLAVYAAIVVAVATAACLDNLVLPTLFGNDRRLAVFLAGAFAVMLIGIADDVWTLAPREKLLGQILVGSVVIATGYRVEWLGGTYLGLWAYPITLLWVVVVTNAFNLIDGLDGLAAGIGVIICATLFSVLTFRGEAAPAMLLAALGGALLGFLRYNFHPATVFLGDSGSLLLGFLLAVVSIGASDRPSAIVAILAPILALGLPLMETALTVARRLLAPVHVVRHNTESTRYEFLFLRRKALFSADRRHIHHRLLDLGITHRRAVLLLYGVCALLCVLAMAIVASRQLNLAFLLLAFGIAAVFGIRRLDYGEMQVLRNGVLLPFFDRPIVSRRIFHVLLDLVFVLIAYLAALIIATDGSVTPALRSEFLAGAPIVGFVQITSFAAAGLYGRSYRYTGIADFTAILRGLVAASVIPFLTLRLLTGLWPKAAVWVLDGYLLATLAVGVRVSFRILQYLFERRDEGRRILLWGSGKGGLAALREIRENHDLGMRPVGFLDDSPSKRGIVAAGLSVYGPADLEQLIRDRLFDELVIATSKIPPQRLRAIAERCTLAGIPVRKLSIGWKELEPPGVSEERPRASVAEG